MNNFQLLSKAEGENTQDDFAPSARLTASALILYDGYYSGICARKRVEELAASVGLAQPLNVSMWKLDHLKFPAIRMMVAQEASEAVIVIVSVAGDEPLSKAVQQWLLQWLASPVNHATHLWALLEYPETLDGDSPVVEELRRQASKSGLSFGCEAVQAFSA